MLSLIAGQTGHNDIMNVVWFVIAVVSFLMGLFDKEVKQ